MGRIPQMSWKTQSKQFVIPICPIQSLKFNWISWKNILLLLEPIVYVKYANSRQYHNAIYAVMLLTQKKAEI